MVEASHPEIIENNLAIPTNQKPYDFVRLFLWALEKRSLKISLMDLSKENLIDIEN
jgi:hypothetical protein